MSLDVMAHTLTVVGDSAEERAERGEEIQRRRLEFGMNASALARRAGIYRTTLGRVEAGDPKVRDDTIGAVESALDAYEHETRRDVNAEESSAVVRFLVEGVYGADSLVVEGPVENIEELERSVDRIMRRLRDSGDS